MELSKSPITDRSQRLQGDGRIEQPPRPLMSLEANREMQSNQTTVRGINKGRGNRRNKGNKLPPHEVFRINQKYLESLYSTGNYKRFFVITPEDGSDLGAKNTIKANTDLERRLGGEPKKITELREGKLLIEVQNEQQSVRVKEIEKLHDTKVTVTEHNSLNSCKGTIIYRNKPEYTEAELCEELRKCNVTEVKKIKRREDSIRRTELYILTFDQCNVPEHVKIGWTKLKVREYIPKPRRCFQCQRWGHGAVTCRVAGPICMNCGEEFHGKECTRPSKCANCAEEHPALSKQCFYYRLEEETLHIKYREKVSYREAKEKATDRFVTPGETYASAIQKQAMTQKEKKTPQFKIGKKTIESTAAPTTETVCLNKQTQPSVTHDEGNKHEKYANTIDISIPINNHVDKLLNKDGNRHVTNSNSNNASRPKNANPNKATTNKQLSILNTMDTSKQKNIDTDRKQEDDKVESGNKRHISETEFEAESITTIVNYHNKEKRPAKETTYRTTDTNYRTEDAANKMDASCQPIIPPNAPSPFPQPLLNTLPPPSPSTCPPAPGGPPPQGQRSSDRRHNREHKTDRNDKRTTSTTRK